MPWLWHHEDWSVLRRPLESTLESARHQVVIIESSATLRRKRVLGMADVELIKQMLEQYTQQAARETVASK